MGNLNKFQLAKVEAAKKSIMLFFFFFF